MGKSQLVSFSEDKATLSEQFYTVALSKLSHIGPVLGRSLLSYFGSAEDVFTAKMRDWLGVHGIGRKTLSMLDRDSSLRAAEKETRFSEKIGVRIQTFYDAGYPKLLKEVYDSPLVLYQKGDLDLNSKLNIAIVGTRKPSTYGYTIAEQFSDFLARKGCNVVSGLAYGVDIAAHQAAMKAGGCTTAVLGHGLGTVYPKIHSRQAAEIHEEGALLSEFTSDIGPEGRNFPMRNRIISGICHATIVIEAGEKGGALITARSAFEQDRLVYGIPGDLTRAGAIGTNKLIRDQIAKLLLHPSEILKDLEVSDPVFSEQESDDLEPEEQMVLRSLSDSPKSVRNLLEVVRLPLAKIKEILFSLEIQNLIRQEAGGRYFLARI